MGRIEDLKIKAWDMADKMGKLKVEFDRLQAELNKISAEIAKEGVKPNEQDPNKGDSTQKAG